MVPSHGTCGPGAVGLGGLATPQQPGCAKVGRSVTGGAKERARGTKG